MAHDSANGPMDLAMNHPAVVVEEFKNDIREKP
jgi:hypothetical protein